MARNHRFPSLFWFRDRDGNAAPAQELDRYLDVHLAGEPQPVNRLPLNAEAQERVGQLGETMAGIASRVAQQDQAQLATDQEDKEAIWRQIMTNTPTAFATSTGLGRQVDGFLTSHQPSRPRSSARFAGGFAALNAVLTAVLVIAIAGGAFYTGQRFRAGSGSNGDSPRQLAALTQSGSPEASPDPSTITLPTADDCTVTPLTVDEIMGWLRDPGSASSTRMTIPESALEQIGIPYRIESETSQETMDELVDLQRQWYACNLKVSYLQIWALYDPIQVVQTVMTSVPSFSTEKEIRTYLEGVEKTGRGENLGVYDPSFSQTYNQGFMPLINPDPAMAVCVVYTDGRLPIIETSQIWYDENGVPQGEQRIADNDSVYLPWRFIAGSMEGPWFILWTGSYDFREVNTNR